MGRWEWCKVRKRQVRRHLGRREGWILEAPKYTFWPSAPAELGDLTSESDFGTKRALPEDSPHPGPWQCGGCRLPSARPAHQEQCTDGSVVLNAPPACSLSHVGRMRGHSCGSADSKRGLSWA